MPRENLAEVGHLPRLDALTGLRFLAAGHVLLFHGELGTLPYVGNLVGRGEASVGLFFLLSGFVLAYGDRDQDRRRFWRARFARIYPVYLLGLLVSLPILIGDMVGDPGPVVRAKAVAGLMVLGLVQAWLPETALRWNYPSWSLSDEVFFYGLFPLLPRCLGRRQLVLAIGALWLLSQSPAALAPDTAWWSALVRYNPLLRLPEFLIGVAIGRLFRTRPPATGGALSIAAAVAALALLSAPGHGAKGILTLAFVALVYALAAGGGPIAWVLSRRPALLLGESSYALYILHFPILRYFGHDLTWVAVIVSIAASILAHKLVELPARGLILRVGG